VWKMVPICLYQFLAKERNEINFEDRERSMGDIISMFFETLCLWTATYVSRMSISFSDLSFSFCPFLVRLFLLYIFCVLRGASRFQ